MPLRVTVVLASSVVLDRDTLRSLDRQSLPVDEFEVVVVQGDAGERDRARMRLLAEHRPNFRLHDAEQGSSLGTRLDAGAAAAKGDYVLFLDDGTLLGDQALERLCRFADEHSSDICIGRTSRAGRLPGAAEVSFTTQARAAKDASLLGLVDAARIYRSAFLREAGLGSSRATSYEPVAIASGTYDGPVADGSDQSVRVRFDLEAIARTEAVAVLADYPAFVIPGEETIPVAAGRLAGVTASAVPEELRQEALYAVHAHNLDLVADAALQGHTDGGRSELSAYGEALETHVPASLDERLSPTKRALSRALRAGDVAGLAPIVRQRRTRVRARNVACDWAGGVLSLDLDVRFPDGRPDTDEAPDLALTLHRIVDGVEWAVPDDDVVLTPDPHGTGFHVTARVRPGTIAGGGPLPHGVWFPALRVNDDELTRRVRLPVRKGTIGTSHLNGLTVVGFRDDEGRLALDVGATTQPVVRRLDPDLASVSEDSRGTLLEVGIPHMDIEPGAEIDGRIRIGRFQVPAAIRSRDGRGVLQAWVSGLTGSYRLATQFSAAAYASTGLLLEIDAVGRMTVRRVPPKDREVGATPEVPPVPPVEGGVVIGPRMRTRARIALKRVPGAQAAYRRMRGLRTRQA